MIIKINFDELVINEMKKSAKDFNDTLCYVVLGKPVYKLNPDHSIVKSKKGYKVIDHYSVAKNIDCVCFYRKKVSAKPLLQRRDLNYIAMALMSGLPVQVNEVDYGWYDYQASQREILEYMQSKESAELCVKNVKAILSDTVLTTQYKRGGLDAVHTFLDSYLRDCGYDIDLSSLKITEGLQVYNFYDGYTNIEGCKPVSKLYERYERSLSDKIDLYNQVLEYQRLGFEPELTKQQHDDIGRRLTAMGVDESALESAIESELHKYDIEFDEPIVTPVSACGLYTQILFN